MDLFDLTGKNALITGATHGLGMAMAEGLAQAGACIIVTGTTPPKLEEAITYYHNKAMMRAVTFLMLRMRRLPGNM